MKLLVILFTLVMTSQARAIACKLSEIDMDGDGVEETKVKNCRRASTPSTGHVDACYFMVSTVICEKRDGTLTAPFFSIVDKSQAYFPLQCHISGRDGFRTRAEAEECATAVLAAMSQGTVELTPVVNQPTYRTLPVPADGSKAVRD